MDPKQRPKPKQVTPANPEDAGMICEGSPLGEPSVRVDLKKKQPFHLNGKGERVYHGVPEGFALDKQGALQLVEPAPAPEGKTNG